MIKAKYKFVRIKIPIYKELIKLAEADSRSITNYVNRELSKVTIKKEKK